MYFFYHENVSKLLLNTMLQLQHKDKMNKKITAVLFGESNNTQSCVVLI